MHMLPAAVALGMTMPHLRSPPSSGFLLREATQEMLPDARSQASHSAPTGTGHAHRLSVAGCPHRCCLSRHDLEKPA